MSITSEIDNLAVGFFDQAKLDAVLISCHDSIEVWSDAFGYLFFALTTLPPGVLGAAPNS